MFCLAQLSIADPSAPKAPAGKVVIDELNGDVRLFNDQAGLRIRKSDGVLLGMWGDENISLVDNSVTAGGAWVPLWSAQLMPNGAEKAVNFDGRGSAPQFTSQRGNDGVQTLLLSWPDVAAGDLHAKAILKISLAPTAKRFSWAMSMRLLQGKASLWSVTYPQLVVPAIDATPETNVMLLPLRRGALMPFGRNAPRGDAQQPYPGPSAKFQFLAAYGQKSSRGLFLTTEDAQCNNKVFYEKNYPERNAVVLAVEHWPDNRSVTTQFDSTYPLIAGPFRGDWYDAASIYRDWWINQVWASRGLLADRTDIPDWLKHSVLATRPSTSVPQRTLVDNLAGSKALSQAVNGRPILGVWYGIMEQVTGTPGLNSEGTGQLGKLKPGLAEAVTELRSLNVHHMAYVQSVIYIPSTGETEDLSKAMLAVSRGRDGKEQYYSPGQFAMCRASDWWQNRVREISEYVVRNGFDGIYLDSFGKGANECFDASHGHSLGGGNTVIQGQRAMAQKISAAIRTINPNAVLSGEDPIEAFRNVLQVNLYSKNIWPRYVPIYRVVWGDYSMGFGRVVRASKTGAENMIPEVASMFIEGTVIGRVFPDSSSPELLQPQNAAVLEYIRRAAEFTQAGMDYLRFGQSLRPLDLGTMPTVRFNESTENNPVELPAVIHAVTRSHRDGSVAIVLTNISTQSVKISVPIDPRLRATQSTEKAASNALWATAILSRMDASGKLETVARGEQPWKQAIEIEPSQIVFLQLH